MARAAAQYCTQFVASQQAKLPAPTPAPMTNVSIEGPWQILAAVVLELPISRHHSGYLLVVIDYFTKWAEAIPLRDQTAASVSAADIKICCSFGVLDIVHSDQWKKELREPYIQPSLISLWDPEESYNYILSTGVGIVERSNCSILQLLHCYAETEDDWEQFMPMLIFANRTATHSSTNLSPSELMFGRPPCIIPFQTS